MEKLQLSRITPFTALLTLPFAFVACGGEEEEVKTKVDVEDGGINEPAGGGTPIGGASPASTPAGGGQTASGGQASSGGASGSGGSANECEAGSFCEVLTPELYQQFFPMAQEPYSYEGLIAAADNAYDDFANVGDLDARKREAAAFLANIAHETGSLRYAEEIICEDGAWMTNPACAVYGFDGKSYHGRGAIQLSWPGNYSDAGDALGVDLLGDPDQVASDPELAISTAIWFWMDQCHCHGAINGGMGFGSTVRAINGVECRSDDPQRIAQWENRLALFERFTEAFGIETGDTSGCR